VLVGEEGSSDAILSAPIILYDYPQVAPESPGDLCDGTEIDEILSLRVLTLTDEERRTAAELDDHSRAIVERTERLARGELLALHGKLNRDPPLPQRG
jgi:hydrogenase maturation protease